MNKINTYTNQFISDSKEILLTDDYKENVIILATLSFFLYFAFYVFLPFTMEITYVLSSLLTTICLIMAAAFVFKIFHFTYILGFDTYDYLKENKKYLLLRTKFFFRDLFSQVSFR